MRKFLIIQFVILMSWAGMQMHAENTVKEYSEALSDRYVVSGQNEQAIRPCGKWSLYGDLLVWKASEETEANWANAVRIESLSKTVFEAVNLTFDWDVGFRIGGGYEQTNHQWDTQFYWTKYSTKSRDSLQNEDGIILTEFFAGFFAESFGAHPNVSRSAKIEWSLVYNMFDWELGKTFLVCKNLLLRPFLGLKGGWINQTIHSQWENVQTSFPFSQFPSTENLKNNFWGIGPSGGINSRWNLLNRCGQTFCLLGEFSGATMWGSWKCTDVYENPTPQKIDVKMRDLSLGALMLRAFFGVGWDTDFNRGRYHFSTKLGYEMQFWFNQLRIPTFQQLLLHGDLTFQGGTLNCRLDF